MDQASRDRGYSKLVYIVAAIAATGGLLFGFDTGVISGALLFLRETFQIGSAGQGIVVSSVLVGCIFGAAMSGRLTDVFGRKLVILVTALIFALGSVVSSLAPGVGLLIGGRVIIGLAIGVASYAVPLYISEMSPPKVRGALVSLNQLMITIGILVSYFVDGAFAHTEWTWRWMFFVGVVPAVVLFLGMLFLPRSPRWLATQDREGEARKVLLRLGVPDADGELGEMRKSRTAEGHGELRELLSPWVRPALIIGVGVMFVQQCTGINTVIYYAPTIFEMAGFDSAAAAIGATVSVGVINVIFTVVSIYLIDRLGRKPLLYIGLAGMVLSLFALGLAFHFQQILGGGLKWFTMGSLLVYIASFAISLGPIAWLLIAEVYPAHIRGVGMSVATLSNWLFNFIVALTFLAIIDWLGQAGAFWLYAAMGVLGLVFTWLFIPETKGVSLETIEENLRAGKAARNLGV
ncbi:MAG: transporter, family, galactose:H+ symporter [Desulfovibrionales bacterium]|nr:transporter, family, galactose:H+ symporter [Desulfovibrionales bacterium]